MSLQEPEWVRVPGGVFQMGSDEFYPEEQPRHVRMVQPFSLSRGPITNRQFAAFVAATGYQTTAEQPLDSREFAELTEADRAAGSMVFTPTAGPVDLGDWRQWWRWVPGAYWRQPQGPGSSIQELADHPVVQVSFSDALAYAEWVGGRLPSEAELEFAALGGTAAGRYAWGDERDPQDEIVANTWHGRFPYRNDGAAGWRGTSPVGAFPANGYGLFDCVGNVWEWTTTVFTHSHHDSVTADGVFRGGLDGRPEIAPVCGCGAGRDEIGRPSITTGGTGSDDAYGSGTTAESFEMSPVSGGHARVQRVLKGGSHLCAPEYCLRYRPAARIAQDSDGSSTHIGFRVAHDR